MKKLFLLLLVVPALACSMLSNAANAPKVTQIRKPARSLAAPSPTGAACHVQTGVDAGRLNMRASPGTSAALVTILHEGEPITLQNKPAANGWLYINARSVSGWVNPNYIKCEVNHE